MDVSNYDALRGGCGLISRTERGRILLTGADRGSFLQGLLTNDIQSLAPGSGVYAAWLTPQGRMIADMNVLELGDAVLLDVPRELTRALVGKLEDSIFAEDVTVRDASSQWAQLAAAGPDSPRIVQQVAGIDPLVVHRHAGLGEVVFDLYARVGDEGRLHEALSKAGALPVGADAAEAFRIEAGIPRWGFDLGEEVIPLEAGIEGRAISFTKGCYVGQEVIVRVLHRGHGRVARKLVSLSLPEATPDRLPPAGTALRSASRDVGRITSVAWSPRLGHGVALGYAQRDFVGPGTEFTTSAGRAVVRE